MTVAVQAPASPPSPPAAAGFIIVLCGTTLRCVCAASTRLTHPYWSEKKCSKAKLPEMKPLAQETWLRELDLATGDSLVSLVYV